jgi:hypothetical protein
MRPLKLRFEAVPHALSASLFLLIYPFRHNAPSAWSEPPRRSEGPLLPPGQRPSGPAAAAELEFREITARFNGSLGFEPQRLEFLPGFTA